MLAFRLGSNLVRVYHSKLTPTLSLMLKAMFRSGPAIKYETMRPNRSFLKFWSQHYLIKMHTLQVRAVASLLTSDSSALQLPGPISFFLPLFHCGTHPEFICHRRGSAAQCLKVSDNPRLSVCTVLTQPPNNLSLPFAHLLIWPTLDHPNSSYD